jgi:hypothetical protein
MQIRPALSTLALGLTLTVGLATAAPRPARPAPSQASTLTPQEQHCEQLGALVAQAAEARDAGIPLLRLLQAVRRPPRTGTATMQANLEAILRMVYVTRRLSPQRMQQETELACLDRATPTEVPSHDARLRY